MTLQVTLLLYPINMKQRSLISLAIQSNILESYLRVIFPANLQVCLMFRVISSHRYKTRTTKPTQKTPQTLSSKNPNRQTRLKAMMQRLLVIILKGQMTLQKNNQLKIQQKARIKRQTPQMQLMTRRYKLNRT